MNSYLNTFSLSTGGRIEKSLRRRVCFAILSIRQGKNIALVLKQLDKNAIFFFFLDCLSFFEFRFGCRKRKVRQGGNIMYQSIKRKVASCLGVLGKRRYGLSNNHDPPTVCCAVGGILWTQQCTRNRTARNTGPPLPVSK